MSPAFKKHVMRLVNYFQSAVLADEYDINVVFSTADEDDKAAQIRTDEIYLNATITIHPPTWRMWQAKDYEALAKVIAHEACHLLTEPLYGFAYRSTSELTRGHLNELRERSTERISKILFRRTPKSVWQP